ncbi:hypothetical protein V2G26_007982 [Clonostachys chloroleuca]
MYSPMARQNLPSQTGETSLRHFLINNLLDLPLERLAGLELGHIHGGDEPRSLGEEISHLLKRSPGGLGKEGPEEEGVGEVTDLGSLVITKATAFTKGQDLQ